MKRIHNSYLLLAGLATLAASAVATASETLTPSEKVAQLKQDCRASAEARADRHAETPLYERLGGRGGIEAVVEETVRLHGQNDTIAHLMEGVDRNRLVRQVTDFLAAATGGDVAYEGRNMVEAHAHLDINDEEFLAAGGDVAKAMKAHGQGDAEVEEVTCMFVSLHEQVVSD